MIAVPRRRLVLAVPAALAVLSGCDVLGGKKTPPSAVDVDPEPTVLEGQAETADPTSLRLPLDLVVMILVKPGWTSTPQQLDGVLVGTAEGKDTVSVLALDEDGTRLWSAKRPSACTGHVLARGAKGAGLAVLADLRIEDGQVAGTTVTAYDLRSAEKSWGPVDVPGGQATPGAVYAAAGEDPTAAGGERVALDTTSGEIVLRESDLDEGRIIAEHHGTILLTSGQELLAVSATDGSRTWSLPLPEGITAKTARIRGRIDPDAPLALLAGEDETGVVLDLEHGRVLLKDVDQVATDISTTTVIAVSGRTVQAREADGSTAWRHEDPEQLDLISAGGRTSYATRPEEGTLVALDDSDGTMIQPYDVDGTGPLGVPELFTAEGAVAVRAGGEHYVVTTTLDMNYGAEDNATGTSASDGG